MGRLPSVSSLMSPPEPKPFESFNSTYPHRMSQDQSYSSEIKLAPISYDRKRTHSEMNLPSPPVTPYTGNKNKSIDPEQPDGDALVTSSRDPVLFSGRESISDIATDEPLFGPMLPPAAEVLLEQHIDSHMARFANKVNKPTREEYRLALSCVSNVPAQYNRNPVAWAKEEREILERQLVLMNRHRPEVSNGRLKRIAPAPAKRVVPAQSRVQRTPRVKRTPKSTPKQKAQDSFDVHTPNSKPSRAAGTSRDDTDFNSIKDYSPSFEVLDGNTKAKSLKADWKGQMLDLSNDPDRHLLSPAEFNLAATLRLTCATYLCSKRRIFEARVRALKVGKEFRKTDAQQACKIDVNKASKLWTAYDKAELFQPRHFQEYLN
ncbi:SWIRM domain-containing protein [Aspergillus undulatus]|uniref:SWIRM domain-containing protein n=1 Tax=Aspergillus undulatus TaxID=1810928 RepID=UPI003CCE0E0C